MQEDTGMTKSNLYHRVSSIWTIALLEPATRYTARSLILPPNRCFRGALAS